VNQRQGSGQETNRQHWDCTYVYFGSVVYFSIISSVLLTDKHGAPVPLSLAE